MNAVQQAAFDRVMALRDYSRQHGLITRRAQNALLASLNEEDLTAVIFELMLTEKANGTERHAIIQPK